MAQEQHGPEYNESAIVLDGRRARLWLVIRCVINRISPVTTARTAMIKVINIEARPRIPVSEGHVRKNLGPYEEGTRVHIAIENVDPGKTCRLAPSDRTQVAYILEGEDAKVTHTIAGKSGEETAQRRSGIYLEPGEDTTI